VPGLGGQVHQDVPAVGAASAGGQNLGGELRAGHRAGCSDQQPFASGRRALPGQVQHVHIAVAVSILSVLAVSAAQLGAVILDRHRQAS
jgi:hypothetical protein